MSVALGPAPPRAESAGFQRGYRCAGQVIKPAIISLPENYDGWFYTCFPKDREIIPGNSFHEVQTEGQKARDGFGSREISRSPW